ncbi:MAG: dihydropteroate synthase [Bacteroidales bacterium]|nr:dihydropteroate synthase [Bacteroidales bacterium]
MGILNYTEDSFYDGGRYSSQTQLLSQTEKMISAGVTILDIGAVSTRPGANDVDSETELFKVEKLLKLILHHFPSVLVSVDTWRSEVARLAVEHGAAIINDISGGTFDPKMPEVIGKLQVPYCLMHTTAHPKTMQQQLLAPPTIPQMLQFFGKQIELFRQNGCNDIIIDPGFGFGKTLQQNYFLLNNLSAFQIFGVPILIGVSRKSMIYKLLDITPEEALNGTSILNTIALLNGANILRVHDVKEAEETIKIVQQLELCRKEIIEN